MFCATISAAGGAHAQACGNPYEPPRGHGPYDYRVYSKQIALVEKFHFNGDVQAGRPRGQNGNILVDLDFVLQVSPNHHRALDVLMKYHLKNKPIVPYSQTLECYFDRARRYRPDDGMIHLLSGIYFARAGDGDQALASYLTGLEMMPTSAELHYNLGLLYVELGRPQEANLHAVQAYSLGAQVPGLKRKLKRLGAWDPDVVPPQASLPEESNESTVE